MTNVETVKHTLRRICPIGGDSPEYVKGTYVKLIEDFVRLCSAERLTTLGVCENIESLLKQCDDDMRQILYSLHGCSLHFELTDKPADNPAHAPADKPAAEPIQKIVGLPPVTYEAVDYGRLANRLGV